MAIDTILDQAGFLGLGPISAPIRARALAAVVETMAQNFERLPSTPEGAAQMESLAEDLGLNAAWREIHGIKGSRYERHARLMLIDCIDTVSRGAQATRKGCDLKAIIARPAPEPPLEIPVPHTTLDVVAGLAELALGIYSTLFPMEATKVDRGKLVIAINAWREGGGRPKKGTLSKWQAIRDVLITAELATHTTDPDGLAEQWGDFKQDARGRWMPRVLRFE